MTRQILYKFKIGKDKCPTEKISMFQFEAYLDEIKDAQRLISETIQLENYIFGDTKTHESSNIAEVLLKPAVLNDLQMRLGIREKIYEEVHQFRRNAYELNSRQNQNIIKKKKNLIKVKDVVMKYLLAVDYIEQESKLVTGLVIFLFIKQKNSRKDLNNREMDHKI